MVMKLSSLLLLLLLASALSAAVCFELRATGGAHHRKGEAGVQAPQAPFGDANAMQVWTANALKKYGAMMLWTPSCFDGAYTMSNKVILDGPTTGVINAAMKVYLEGDVVNVGIGVEGPFFGGDVNRLSQKFTYLHEIGHASTEHVLSTYLPQVQLAINGRHKTDEQPCIAPTVSGAATEVIADLTAACYLASQPTFNLEVAKASLEANTGGPTSMFDNGWSGHHPKASQRIKYVEKLWDGLSAKESHDFANDCIPLMRAQLMELDEQSPDFQPGGTSDPSKYCAEASTELGGK